MTSQELNGTIEAVPWGVCYFRKGEYLVTKELINEILRDIGLEPINDDEPEREA